MIYDYYKVILVNTGIFLTNDLLKLFHLNMNPCKYFQLRKIPAFRCASAGMTSKFKILISFKAKLSL